MLLQSKYNLEKQIVFFRQLAAVLQSGLPLLRGLQLLERQSEGESLLYYRLRISLSRGSSFAEALAAEPEHFSRLAVSMAAVGEESGELSNLLLQLADYYERQDRLRRFVQRALIYPLLLLVAALLLLLLFGFYILPMLLETYTAMGINPAGSLALVLRLRSLLLEEPLLGVLSLVLLAATLLAGGRRLLHWFLRSRWSGNFHGLLIEVRLCKLLALLLEAGLAITRAVSIAMATVEDEECVTELRIFNSRLRRGLAVEQAAAAAEGLFSPLTLELICVGAATGYLPRMLEEAASAGEVRLTEQLERLRQLLVPVLLLMAALIVAVVIITVISPLFELLTALPE